MTKWQRIKEVLGALGRVLLVIILLLAGADAYIAVVGLISMTMCLYGLEKIIYYFKMARHMVGGKIVLYLGTIIFNVGALTGSMYSMPGVFVMFYLLAVNSFMGVLEILNARQAKSFGSNGWKIQFTQGGVNILVGLLGLLFVGNHEVLIYLYCFGLIYSVVMKIVRAFQPTSIIYIN